MVTVDQIVDILAQTVCSIKGSCGLLLATVMNRDFSRFRGLMIFWLVCVIVVRAVIKLNRRIVDDPASWKPPVAQDAVVVTGAASGLGLLIAGLLSERGIKVIALDKAAIPIGIANCKSFTVDISDEEAVKAIAGTVMKDTGAPKAIIHCAGIVIPGYIKDLSFNAIASMMKVNYLGNLWVTKAFLDPMLGRQDGAMIITVASSTALAAPAGAGIYAGTKAALRLTYEAFRYETQDSQLRSLVYTPGQLDTAMFQSLDNPSPWFSPTLRGVDVAVDIVDALYRGRTGEIRRPLYAFTLPVASLLPQSLVDYMRHKIGIDRAMETF
ncbi:putative oxidoreductase C16H5.14c [Wickerhamiella sorbophila]|uniref:Putative oxidoreductase C16H5.14c n=1 Tax=Wickerhamiella sorbophila TaxID=45607 RepID=A0A2T0FH09_9ASCO|nr:putative oxidoreductase C16H5.14c [Wickerhamiella sorbophila]PRT54293.1 putative oxidoreductase C16H5.14c [Wickerhamiella sorbophila]